MATESRPTCRHAPMCGIPMTPSKQGRLWTGVHVPVPAVRLLAWKGPDKDSYRPPPNRRGHRNQKLPPRTRKMACTTEEHEMKAPCPGSARTRIQSGPNAESSFFTSSIQGPLNLQSGPSSEIQFCQIVKPGGSDNSGGLEPAPASPLPEPMLRQRFIDALVTACALLRPPRVLACNAPPLAAHRADTLTPAHSQT